MRRTYLVITKGKSLGPGGGELPDLQSSLHFLKSLHHGNDLQCCDIRNRCSKYLHRRMPAPEYPGCLPSR